MQELSEPQPGIKDPQIVATSGKTHCTGVTFNGRNDVRETLFEITDAEPAAADQYEQLWQTLHLVVVPHCRDLSGCFHGYEWPLRSDVTDCNGSFAHCRIFESGRSAAILLTLLIEILQ